MIVSVVSGKNIGEHVFIIKISKLGIREHFLSLINLLLKPRIMSYFCALLLLRL